MNTALTSSLAAILSAPWQQRRNQNGMWGVALIAALCVLAPVALAAWSLFADPLVAPNLRHSAAVSGRIAVVALSMAWWAVLVNNVLEQNHPTPAQLVPEHPRRLRAALLVTGAALAAAQVAVAVGAGFDAWVAVASVAPAIALLAAFMRWPWLWFIGFVTPYAVGYAVQGDALSEFGRAALGAWRQQTGLITAALVMASALLIASLIQSGGPRHAAAYERRTNRLLRMRAASRGQRLHGPGAPSLLEQVLARPYHRWMRHLLARPASSPRARALLALGPGVHWTGNAASLVATAVAVSAALVLALLVAQVFPEVGEYLPMGLSGISIGAMFGLVAPAMQVQARLHQTRREQSLLVLLPGVPRGVAQSRWLSWQLTRQFLLSWVGAVALMLAFSALARELQRNPFEAVYATGRVYVAIASLPLIALQWRRWACLPAPTSLTALWPILLGLGLAALAFAGQLTGVATPLQCGVVFALAAIAWCAWRRWRMASDPAALPIGRLA